MIRKLLKKLGAVKAAIVVTGVSILFSALIYMVLSSILEQISVMGILISIVIPAIIAPTLSYSFLRVLIELDVAEKNLRKSEGQYRDIFENVSEFLYFHDLEGHFTKTNLAFRTEYGYSEEDLVNLNIRDLIPELHKRQFEDYLRTV